MLGNVVLLRLQSDCDCLQEEERARREEEEQLRRLEELEKQRQEQVGSVFYCCKQRCSLTPNSPQLTSTHPAGAAGAGAQGEEEAEGEGEEGASEEGGQAADQGPAGGAGESRGHTQAAAGAG